MNTNSAEFFHILRICTCTSLTGPIPQQWIDVGRPDQGEASHGLSTYTTRQLVKSSWFKSADYGSQSAGVQNFANWQCWLALNPPKNIYSIRIHPLDPGGHMLPQKLLVGVIVLTRFPAKSDHQWPKSAWPAAHSACIASSRPFALVSDPHQVFHIESHVFAFPDVFANLRMVLSCAELWARTQQQAISMATWGLPPPPHPIT
jgi:hypothetical protein